MVPADAVRAGMAADPAWELHPSPGSWWPFAGLWDRAETRDGEVESFAIVTLDAERSVDTDVGCRPLRLIGGDVLRWLDLSADVSGLLSPRATALNSEISAA